MTDKHTHFVAVAEASELAPGQMKRISVNGRALLLVNAEGEYFAVDEMCTHEDYSLYFGCIRGRHIKCSLHGSHFDLASGEALDEPADESLGTYPVKVQEGRVWVGDTRLPAGSTQTHSA